MSVEAETGINPYYGLNYFTKMSDDHLTLEGKFADVQQPLIKVSGDTQ